MSNSRFIPVFLGCGIQCMHPGENKETNRRIDSYKRLGGYGIGATQCGPHLVEYAQPTQLPIYKMRGRAFNFASLMSTQGPASHAIQIGDGSGINFKLMTFVVEQAAYGDIRVWCDTATRMFACVSPSETLNIIVEYLNNINTQHPKTKFRRL